MNNRTNRMLIFLVVFLLITNIAMLVYFTSFHHNIKPDKKGPGITAFLQNDLAFSKEQMVQLDSLKKQHRQAMKPLFEALGKSKDSFYALIGQPNTTDSLLQAAAARIGENQTALDLQFYRNFRTLRNLCTREQLPKFDSVMPGLAARMMQPWKKPPTKN